MGRSTVILSVLALGAAAALADERLERLSPDHRKWIEEEVVYIVTEKERDLFLSLETLEERGRFIQAFWSRRDPDPATLENEFRDEHYRRLRYANEVLGRETARPGWKTDRGRYYILLGTPEEIQPFYRNELMPMELWLYRGDTTRGLPAYFRLLFFQRRGMGEFELYHPVHDGPRELVQGGEARWPDNRAALRVIRDVSGELARATLSYDPADSADHVQGRPALGTDLLLARIEDLPRRSAETSWVDAWRRYGHRVSADYSFNFVASRSTFAALEGPDATPFLHYSIEIDPQNFNLQTDEERRRFVTVLDVDVEVRTPEGSLVVAKKRAIPVEMTASQFEAAQRSPVAIQDCLPLVAGRRRVSIVVQNRVLKQYTVAETELDIHRADSDEPGLTDLVVGFAAARVPDPKDGEVRPFQIGDRLVHPAAERVFALDDSVHVLSQWRKAHPGDRLRFQLVGGNELLREWEFELERYRDGVVSEALPLDAIEVAGDYELRMALLRASGEVRVERSSPLRLSPRTAIRRAGFHSRRGFNGAAPGLLALEKGEQLLALGRTEEAIAELERAVAAENPDLPEARWKLASAYVNRGNADRTLELLEPIESSFPDQFEVAASLGFAHYYQLRFERAAHYLEKAGRLRPPYPGLLNALGECYERLGDPARARESYQRSLDLDPDQPLVRELLDRLGPAPR